VALPLDALFVALQGVFIGAEGSRVPDKLLHESCSLTSSRLPRKRGLGRVSAALVWWLATRFGAWLLLVRPSGRFLLEAASWLLILGFRDNLGIKLPRSSNLPISFKRISLFLHSYLWLLSLYCKCLGLNRSLSFPLFQYLQL